MGDLSLIDSSHPYDGRYSTTDDAHVSGVGIDLPASLLPVPPHRVRELIGRRLSGREGIGALLADFLLSLDRQAATLGPAEAARLGSIVADLTAVWIACELDAVNTLPQESRQQALVESVRAFIRHHLHDPGLTPATIAAAHHIPVSYLNRLFTRHSDGRTVAAFVRDQRLKKACRDLADPALRALPVQAVAARCGIPRASDFGRAFKAAYGLSPHEYRNAHTAGTPSEGVPAVPGSGPGQDVVTPPVLSEEPTLVQ
ncbi:helix-turn-helix domain-containing protein [Kitasatospora sp. NPDC048298]|uniref:helix-turn-helix domain-containing protein n=1 Tax=Kitasatospora sp. NPDC048298 TaxID=3364049 RepID=UPI00371C5661